VLERGEAVPALRVDRHGADAQEQEGLMADEGQETAMARAWAATCSDRGGCSHLKSKHAAGCAEPGCECDRVFLPGDYTVRGETFTLPEPGGNDATPPAIGGNESGGLRIPHPATDWGEQWRELYQNVGAPSPYDDDAVSYQRAGAFLSGPGLVEEWGCATTWGSRFVGAPYRGVDGAEGVERWGAARADLREYVSRPRVPKILMRHVLEHNWEWGRILANMTDSFTDRAVLVLFIPPGDRDADLPGAARVEKPGDPPGLQLNAETLANYLDRPGLEVEREVLHTRCPPFDWEELIFMRWTIDRREHL
jgi:hypothetical protein